jgi:putative ABC transport system permease protein
MQLPDDVMKLTATGVSYAVRFSPTTHTGFNALRQRLQQKYPEQAIYSVQTMEEIITATLERRRLVMVLLTGFAVFALALASIGIYGVISYVVAQRTQEIGIRMAMGARRADVLRMIARQGLRLIVIGLVCGSVAAMAVTRALNTMLFGVKAFDVTTFLATALLLLVIAMLAIGVPAVRATTVNPVIALRDQ